MNTTTTHQIGDIVVINLSATVGQESAIEANNGNPIVEVKVVSAIDESGCGFGRVRSLSSLGGYQVLFTSAAIVPDRMETLVRHCGGLVHFTTEVGR